MVDFRFPGRVEAVSVALPQDVMMNGKLVRTSILREAVNHPVFFDQQGPKNNRTAVHSEHVLATPLEHYSIWPQQLGLDASNWKLGYWGENLTISGILDENRLPIGTTMKFGTDVLLQVVGPRLPCYKLMWRMGQPDSFIPEMMLTGQVGIYLKVLETGWIKPGDRIEIIDVPERTITVGELARQLSRKSPGNADKLLGALAIPCIGGQAAAAIRRKLNQVLDGTRAAAGRWQGWRRFTISKIEDVGTGMKSFVLSPNDNQPIAGYLAGQHLPVRLRAGLIRNWSISDYDEDANYYRITVKRHDKGRASPLLHQLSEGDAVELRNPQGTFNLDRSSLYRPVLISAGIGLTPLLSMLKAHAKRPSPPPAVWVHSTRNRASHAHREEVNNILTRHRDFKSIVAYSSPRQEERLGEDFDIAGRLNEAAFHPLLEPYPLMYVGNEIQVSGLESSFYICGPADFEAHVRDILIKAGVSPEKIHSEQFSPQLASGQPAEQRQVEVIFSLSGKHAEWSTEAPISLLELAEENGLEPDFECRSGTCHRCETRLISGEVSYLHAPAVAPREGYALLCCSTPSGAHVELEL